MNKSFGFLLFPEFEDMDLVGPWEMIGLWQRFCGGPQAVFTVSETGGLVNSTLGLSIQSHYAFSNCPKLDYLLVPGGQGTRKENSNPQLIAFIKQQAQHCQAVLSVCTGSFLLAAAGLLENKRATTHHESMDRLRAERSVTAVSARYVQDNNIWTSSGISAGIDLALAFIAATASERVAGEVQLHAEYYPSQKIYAAGELHLPSYTQK